MLSFSFKSLSFKFPLTQKRNFFVSIELAEGSPKTTETVVYIPRNNIAIFSETLEFKVRNPNENTYFNLEIFEILQNQEKQRISKETFHINKMSPHKSTQLTLATTFTTKAILEFTLELSDEFKGLIAEQENSHPSNHSKRREQALSVDHFNPFKMGPLMYEFIFALSPLYLLKKNVINFVTWKDPNTTLFLSIGLTIFIWYHQILLGLGFLGFFILSRKIIPMVMQMKPPKDEVKGVDLYKRNLEIMRELMQITVWADEMQNKMFNNPDKTFLLQILLTVKKFSLILGVVCLIGRINVVLLAAYWCLLFYHTKTGGKFLILSYHIFSNLMESVESLILPALKLEEKFFATHNLLKRKSSVGETSPSSANSIPDFAPEGSSAGRKNSGQKVVNQKTFVVYENQRWWVIGGWKHKMYGDERGPWSDDLGKLPISKESFRLPGPSWQWEADWTVAVNANTDKDGWEYGDTFKAFHKEGSIAKGLVHLVRRRKWIRRCVEVKE